MNADVKKLVERAEQLLGKRFDLLTLWQTIADNFYVERATFTVARELGAEFADHLMTSYPLMVRRDLGNQFSGMLRPTSKDWFKMSAEVAERDIEARRWLQYATAVQKRAMYDRRAQFVRATKLGDHDFAAFGQCVIEVCPNKDRDGLLFRNWHLRDVAWCENAEGEIDTIVRKWKPTVFQLDQLFPNKVSAKRKRQLEQDPYAECNCLHMMIPSATYQGEKKWRTKYVSLFIDQDEMECLEEVGQHTKRYVIPRWQHGESQYAYSPATVIALPDARLLQAMTLTLLEAGEKAVNPPLVGVQSALRSDLQVFAGGFTAVDMAYDGKLSEVLRPLSVDKNGLPFGMEVREEIKSALMEAFYLNKITLPPVDGSKMTAYEVSQRVGEYIRQALPLFEPMESEYNGALCEESFVQSMHLGAFGPMDEIPHSLSGVNVTFRFESPLQEATERQKASIFMEAQQLIAGAAQLDPSAPAALNAPKALRSALLGIGMAAENIRSEEEVAEIQEQDAAKAEAAQAMQLMQQGADVAATAGKAVKEMTL